MIIVGSGNVATHLGKAFADAGIVIEGICSATHEHAASLAELLGCQVIENPAQIPVDTDFVLIAATDSAIEQIAIDIPRIKGVVAHTSGSVPLNALTLKHKHAAVVYPLQTFSKGIEVDLSRVPFFTEASDAESLKNADNFAGRISNNVRHADSDLRARLHVAGVLSSNFIVELLDMTANVLKEANLPLDTVQPLVEATVAKAFSIGPNEAMTGPARRGDIATIEKQFELLSSPTDRLIYGALSQSILQKFHPELCPGS